MFSLSALISRRYLFSKKSHSVINIISWVSCVAVGVPVAGMIILLSVFNGFEHLVKQMYNSFDSDLLIEAKHEKFFSPESLPKDVLTLENGIINYSGVLEQNALVEYKGRQMVATIRGVDSLYGSVIPISSLVSSGEFKPMFGFIEQALVGQGIAYQLGVNTNLYDRLRVYAASSSSFSSLLPMGGFKSETILPSGLFTLDAQSDSKYVIVPISFAQKLFSLENRYSHLVVKTSDKFDLAHLRESMGEDFRVLTRYEQKADIYRLMSYEKWGIFFILALVMLVASFAIVGSIVMLILDKKHDTQTLITLGASQKLVRRVFVGEGMLIALFGAFGGGFLGLGFCFAQQYFGFIKIPARTFLVDSYPILVSLSDVAAVFALFFVINYIITYLSVRISLKK